MKRYGEVAEVAATLRCPMTRARHGHNIRSAPRSAQNCWDFTPI